MTSADRPYKNSYSSQLDERNKAATVQRASIESDLRTRCPAAGAGKTATDDVTFSGTITYENWATRERVLPDRRYQGRQCYTQIVNQ